MNAMSGDQIRFHIGRLKAKKAMLLALKSAPAEAEATKALDQVKKTVTDADNDLATKAKTAEKDRQNCLAKRGCNIAADITKGTTRCDDFTQSSENVLSIIDNNAQTYSCAEDMNAQLNPELQKKYIDQSIASIDEAIKEYEKSLTSFTIPHSQLAQHAADDKEQLDANWMRFSFDSAASKSQTDSSSSYSSVSTSVSVGFAMWSASASYSRSKSQQNFKSSMNSAKVAVQGELLRVTIQRPWFRPSLFQNAHLQMVSIFYSTTHAFKLHVLCCTCACARYTGWHQGLTWEDG